MLPYHPALRFKQGEYTAGAKIARDIQRHVVPRFIIPPDKSRTPKLVGHLVEKKLPFLLEKESESIGRFTQPSLTHNTSHPAWERSSS
ncbi:beta family protein [Bradyrhizobium oligotrophicum S58]